MLFLFLKPTVGFCNNVEPTISFSNDIKPTVGFCYDIVRFIDIHDLEFFDWLFNTSKLSRNVLRVDNRNPENVTTIITSYYCFLLFNRLEINSLVDQTIQKVLFRSLTIQICTILAGNV